jgi:hypothetical protein
VTRGSTYQPGKDRLRARFTVLRYGSPGKQPVETGETAIVVHQGFTYGMAALAGRRAGDRVRLLMSPDIAQSPVYGTPKHQSSWNTHVSGTTGYFDITIDRVCEPQIWRCSGAAASSASGRPKHPAATDTRVTADDSKPRAD